MPDVLAVFNQGPEDDCAECAVAEVLATLFTNIFPLNLALVQKLANLMHPGQPWSTQEKSLTNWNQLIAGLAGISKQVSDHLQWKILTDITECIQETNNGHFVVCLVNLHTLTGSANVGHFIVFEGEDGGQAQIADSYGYYDRKGYRYTVPLGTLQSAMRGYSPQAISIWSTAPQEVQHMGSKEELHDTGTTLTNTTNSFVVGQGFRQYILDHDPDLGLPLSNEVHWANGEPGNPSMGPMQAQFFQKGILGYAPNPTGSGDPAGVYIAWSGQIALALSQELEAVQKQVQELQQQDTQSPAASSSTTSTNDAPAIAAIVALSAALKSDSGTQGPDGVLSQAALTAWKTALGV